ncbi:hypothetical protein P3T16_006677, partial [Paraburkholderia sp. GAS42]
MNKLNAGSLRTWNTQSAGAAGWRAGGSVAGFLGAV